jgi:spore germination protein KA
VALIYITDLVDNQVLQELKNRMKSIDIDSILATGYIESFIEDNPWSPFPFIHGTERPDKAAANILEGRILIMANGTPFTLIVPALFMQFFQATEDYYEKLHVGLYARLLRFMAFIIAITAPASYIALTAFHPELIPSELLVTLARMRREVPFPPFIEALFMEFVIEALREAGIRLPKSVAQTLGVVGGIVLGEAAIRANLVSPAMVLVATMTAVCTFSIPNYSMSLVIRLLRLLIIFLAAMFGGFGITVGLLIILIHLAKQKSMGIPYLAPAAPLRLKDMKDFLYRAPLWKMKNRPVSIPSKDKVRVNTKGKGGKDEQQQ